MVPEELNITLCEFLVPEELTIILCEFLKNSKL